MPRLSPIKVLILGQDKFSNVMGKAEKNLGRFSSKAKTVGRDMTAAFTVPLGLAAVGANKLSMDFNKAMANVGTLIPGNQKRLKELKAGVQSLAIETGKSTDDISAGLFQVISAFGDSADTMNILRVVSRGAVAGVAEVKDALNLTSLVTKNYGDTSAAASQKVLDLAFKANELGQTTFPEMAAAMGPTIPLAKTLGVSMEELFGVMGTFTGVTGNTSEVTTQLRGVLGALIKPTGDMEIALKKLGVRSGEELIKTRGLQGAMDALVKVTKPYPGVLGKVLGRKEALTMVLAANGELADAFTEKTMKMNNAAGAAEKAFKEQTEGINKAGFAWQQMTVRVTVLAQKFGDAFAPVLLKVIDKLVPLFKWLTALSPATQKWVLIIGSALAAIGPIILAIGTFTAVLGPAIIGIKALGAALMFLFANPIGLVILAVAALIAGIILLIKNWDKVVAFIKNVWTKTLEGAIAGIKAYVGFWINLYKWIFKVGAAIATLNLGKLKKLFSFGRKNRDQEEGGGIAGAAPITPGVQTTPGVLAGTQAAGGPVESKVRVEFANEPAGMKVKTEDEGNLSEIERGLATAGTG